MTYIVVGGEYKATDWRELVEGSAEAYGPFAEYADAKKEWHGRTFAKIDNAHHRMFIRLVDCAEAGRIAMQDFLATKNLTNSQ